MKRGEVYWSDLKPRSGSEQAGRRPVILISSDGFNRSDSWQSLIVVPVSTSSAQLKRGPTVVVIPAGTAGLSKASVAVCHQITTLDRAKMIKRIGALPDILIREVDEAVKAALDLD